MHRLFAAVLAASPLMFAAPTQAQTQVFKVGDRVECATMQGVIIRIDPRPGWDEPFYIVRSQGASNVIYENKCLTREMRAVSAAPDPSPKAPAAPRPAGPVPSVLDSPKAAAPSVALCRPGAKLEGAWGISWYEVTVVAAPNASGQCKVNFDGYGSTYENMMLTQDYLRPRGSGPIVRPNRPLPASKAAAALPAAAPDGVYRCHKISPGGQLMDIGVLTVRGGRGTLAGMPAGWTVRSITPLQRNAQGKLVLAYDYRSAAGFNDRLDCVAQ